MTIQNLQYDTRLFLIYHESVHVNSIKTLSFQFITYIYIWRERERERERESLPKWRLGVCCVQAATQTMSMGISDAT